MPIRQLRIASATPEDVGSALATLRAEIGLPAMYPAEARAEAEAAARGDLKDFRQDRRDIGFVTIDPAGSKDLDQAVHVASSGHGYIVRYAVADTAAFVSPGGALDTEVHRRGVTYYGPDTRSLLYPAVLSEGAASLLPEEDRPVVLWTVSLDSSGEIGSVAVTRAVVRSRARLTYGEAQTALDSGTAPESLVHLADVGRLRQQRERDRGGVSLDVPEQEVVQRADGSFDLELRRTLPVESWNAQISLLTGIAAARLMREAGVGLLRTLPPAQEQDVRRLRRTAAALGIDWPDDVPYGEMLSTVESRRAAHAAFLTEATTLFRGAGYLAFGVPGPGGGARVGLPDDARHAAVGAEYAHVTAPLRRLADRYATEVCLAQSAGRDVPGWVLEALPHLPGTMGAATAREAAFERSCIDIVEAALLAPRVGRRFEAVVVDDGGEPRPDGLRRGEVMLRDPAVRARVQGTELPLGERIKVTLAEASVADRRVLFTAP
ncbi:RNB domain-containing ribonuclease [Isoptericola sp. b408]|uniref:RNB domain-containing ribonuclease n=1 Tax=Isoptericola sp. b408 TaxID=3064653 RepID=UPI0027132E52|nr:RNB domain-containing ribonuclease [Isoptericola sp. b408]MDO8150393.1 RNB domain-containing ribonuclease [Isoptericola sp. b408]